MLLDGKLATMKEHFKSVRKTINDLRYVALGSWKVKADESGMCWFVEGFEALDRVNWGVNAREDGVEIGRFPGVGEYLMRCFRGMSVSLERMFSQVMMDLNVQFRGADDLKTCLLQDYLGFLMAVVEILKKYSVARNMVDVNREFGFVRFLEKSGGHTCHTYDEYRELVGWAPGLSRMTFNEETGMHVIRFGSLPDVVVLGWFRKEDSRVEYYLFRQIENDIWKYCGSKNIGALIGKGGSRANALKGVLGARSIIIGSSHEKKREDDHHDQKVPKP